MLIAGVIILAVLLLKQRKKKSTETLNEEGNGATATTVAPHDNGHPTHYAAITVASSTQQQSQQVITENESKEDNTEGTQSTKRKSEQTHYIPIDKSQPAQITESQSKPDPPTKSIPDIDVTKKHQIPFSDLEIERKIGKGSYGKVCLGRWNDAPVALKFCKGKEGLDNFLQEANLMMYATRKRTHRYLFSSLFLMA